LVFDSIGRVRSPRPVSKWLGALVVVVIILGPLAMGSTAHAQAPARGTAGSFRPGPRPFAATAAQLLQLDRDARAFFSAKEDPPDYVVLWRDNRYVVDDRGAVSVTAHEIYSVRTDAAAQAMAKVEAPWRPGYEDKPIIRARVISSRGEVFTLDPRSLLAADPPAPTDDTFVDVRHVRGPLPGVGPGAVVEIERTLQGRAPVFEGGALRRELVDTFMHTFSSRFSVSAGNKWPLKSHPPQLAGVKLTRHRNDSGSSLLWEVGPRWPLKMEFAPGMPPEVPRAAWVGFSTATSWEDVAGRYSRRLQEVLRGQTVAAVAATLRKEPADRNALIARATTWMNEQIRYTAMLLGEGAVIPRPPTEVLGRRFGDCKDQSVLLLALLRALDIQAYPALVAPAPFQDVVLDLPGLEQFSHMIVYVPGKPALWLDPTADVRPGQVPSALAGRRALVLHDDRPAAFSSLPPPRSADNRVAVAVDVTLREDMNLDVKGAAIFVGAPTEGFRRLRRLLAEPTVDRSSAESAISALAGVEDLKLAGDILENEQGQVTVNFTAEPREVAHAGKLRVFHVLRAFGAIKNLLPGELWQATSDKRQPAPRRLDYVWPMPMTAEVKYRFRVPDGFVLHNPVEDRTWNAGRATVRRRSQKDADGRDLVTIDLDTGPTRLRPSEYEATRQAFTKMAAEPRDDPSYESTVERLRDAGQLAAALAETRRLTSTHPRSPFQQALLVTVLIEARLIEAARREAARALEIDPNFRYAQQLLAWSHEFTLTGQWLGDGFDRATAIKERRRQVAISAIARSPFELARALARDEHGRYLQTPAEFPEIIKQARLSHERGWGDEATALLADALLAAGKHEELEKLVRDSKWSDRNRYLIAAVGGRRGAEAALRELSAIGNDHNVLYSAGLLLSNFRQHQAAVPLLKAAAPELPESASTVEERIKLRRFEDMALDPARPLDVLRRLKIACRSPKTFVAERGRGAGETLFEGRLPGEAGARAVCHALISDPPPSDWLIDRDLSEQYLLEGNRKLGFRIAQRSPSLPESAPGRFFLVLPDAKGRLQLVATSSEEAGREALRLVDRKQLEAAAHVLTLTLSFERTRETKFSWLERVRPLWPDSASSKRDPETMRIAAAALTTVRFPELAKPILERAFAVAPPATKARIGEALMGCYRSLGDPAALVATARALAPDERFEGLVPHVFVHALTKLEQSKEAEEFVAEWRRRKQDSAADDALMKARMYHAHWDAVIPLLEDRIRSGKATGGDNNYLAWALFCKGVRGPRTIELARRAVALSNRTPAYVHTLAAVLADAGEIGEARALVDEIQRYRWAFGRAGILLVLGEIASHLGLTVDARALYERAVAEEVHYRRDGVGPGSSAAAARARLATLGAAGPAKVISPSPAPAGR
jgi:transglutaminase-like putative cysteine protease